METRTYAFEYDNDCYAVFEADCQETAEAKAEFWGLRRVNVEINKVEELDGQT